MTDIVSFGQWMQKRRNQLGLTRSGLARLIGCAPITIKKIERDERRPSFQIAELLTEHLQIPQTEQEDFIRRARGEFVPTLISPEEMTLAEAQAPATEEDSPKHNLPPQTTPFFGRDVELADISKSLADPNCRLLTILGAGGMGKTRLGIEAAITELKNFTDGVFYVALAPIQAENRLNMINPVAVALTEILGISYFGDDSPEQQIIDYLKRKEMLLIFDNCEHLLDATLFISTLLALAPDVKVLTTSRERLQLKEEWIYILQGLPYPDDQNGDREGDLAAVDLFTQRAKQVQPAFNLDAELPAVLRICRLVEGIPLALELAAATVHQMPCEIIADEIVRENDFLATNLRNVPDRHRSLRAVFEYSWRGLSHDEQKTLENLSVFRGGFERTAAKAVAQASFQQLSNLADKSLLHVTINGRYQIHELLRQFAAEKLAKWPDQKTKTLAKHAYTYHALIAQPIPLNVPTETTSKGIISDDSDNLRTAIDWILANDWQMLQKDVILGLWAFYDNQGWFLEGSEIFAKIVSGLKEISNTFNSDHANSRNESLDLTLAFSQSMLGWYQLRLGHFEMAFKAHEASLNHAFSNKPEAKWVKGFALSSWATTLGWHGDLAQESLLLTESTSLFEPIGDKIWYGAVLNTKANNALKVGNFDEAERLAKISNRIDPGERSILSGLNTRTLGRVESARGNYVQAESFMRRSLLIYGEGQFRTHVTIRLVELGDILRLQKKYDEANKFYEKGLALAEDSKLAIGQSIAHWGIANLAVSTGNYATAQYHFGMSKQIANIHSWTLGGPGWASLALGELAEAQELFIKDLSEHNLKRQSLPQLLDTVAGFGHLFMLKGRFVQALELITLILDHPSTEYESKLRIMPIREELLADLSAESVAKALARGKTLDLWETAVSLINDLEAS